MALLLIGLGVVTLARIGNTHAFEALAGQWISEHREAISLDPNSSTTLALVPGAASLLNSARDSDWRIMGGNEPCRVYVGRTADQSAVVGGAQLCLQDLRPQAARPSRR